MREVKIGPKDCLVDVRGLKTSELKTLKEYGYLRQRYIPPQTESGNFDLEKSEEGLDKVLSTVFGPDYMERMEIEKGATNSDFNRLYLAVLSETYGAPNEEKNSPSSGDGSQTRSE